MTDRPHARYPLPHGEGSIYPRGDGRWAVSWRDQRGRRHTVYGRSEAEARGKYKDLRAKLETSHGRRRSPTLKEWCDRWLADIGPLVQVKATTLALYRRVLNIHFVPALGDYRLDQIDPADIQSVLAALLRNGMAPSTLRTYKAILQSVLQAAEDAGLLTRNPAARRRVRVPKAPQPTHVALAPSQLQAIFTAAKGQRLEPLLIVLATTGLRRGEWRGLRWQDVDLEAGILRVEQQVQRVPGKGETVSTPKSAHSRRVIPLPPLAVAAFEQRKRDQRLERIASNRWDNPTGLVFTSRYGTVISEGIFYREWYRILEAAKVPRCWPHVLRHTVSTLLAEQGISPRTISDILGHSTTQLTLDVYTHTGEGARRSALEELASELEKDA